jgi:hypothetical protein
MCSVNNCLFVTRDYKQTINYSTQCTATRDYKQTINYSTQCTATRDYKQTNK